MLYCLFVFFLYPGGIIYSAFSFFSVHVDYGYSLSPLLVYPSHIVISPFNMLVRNRYSATMSPSKELSRRASNSSLKGLKPPNR